MQPDERIRENLRVIRERMDAAAERSGRKPEEIRLIAVSKTKPLSDLLSAYAAGQRAFGENYVQEVLEKAPALPSDCTVHFIGHLQTNKAGKLLPWAGMIHSLDSLRLAAELEKQTQKQQLPPVRALLEINIAGEETKFGFSAEEAPEVFARITRECPHIRIEGLMTSAPPAEDAEQNRPYFAGMRKLLCTINRMIAEDAEGIFRERNTPPLTELSMGMSGDFIPAIEEGATMVRIGTAVFGERNYNR